MEDSSVTVVSTVLADFFDKHPDHVILTTSKILLVLITNASTKTEEKYHKIRLSNPKIEKKVVQVQDALDILAMAGFSRQEECLVWTQSNDEALVQTLCHQLETKIQELEFKKKSSTVSTSASTASTKSTTTESPFLSEEERKKRLRQAKAARKASAAERAATQRRWEEDRQERLEIAKRKERAMQASVADSTPMGVTVRQLVPPDQARGVASMPSAAAAAVSVTDANSTSDMNTESNEVSTRDKKKPVSPSPNEARQQSNTSMDIDATVESNNEKKLPAVTDDSTEELWKSCTSNLSSCEAATGIRDSSIYKTDKKDARPVTCLKRLYRELKELDTSLPKERESSIWIRFDEDSPQYVRALVTAPMGTPYAGGMFCFDVFIPNDYPNGPPKVTLLTTGGGRVRFGPNLYSNGKVCLSLLGTWSGPKWSPSHSNLYQVLVSIQGLILGACQPWYLEPGHGGWEGNVKEGDFVQEAQTLSGKLVKSQVGVPPHVQHYNNFLRVGTVRFAILETLSGTQRHLQAFVQPIQAHFYCNREAILDQVLSWPMDLEETEESRDRMMGPQSKPPGNLKELLPQLEERFSSLVPPSNEDAILVGGGDKKPAAMDTKLVPVEHKVEDDSMKVDNTDQTASVASSQQSNVVSAVEKSRTAPSSSTFRTDDLRSRMQEAAGTGNYILAGQLQEQLTQLQDLERRMQEAASEGNFIRAGRLQEQIEALMDTTEEGGGPTNAATWKYDASAQEGDDSDIIEQMGGLVMGKNMYAPPGHPSTYASGNHHWGSGSALNATTASASTPAPCNKEAFAPSNIVVKKAPPSPSVCRLRIRLPGSQSCVEDFDRNDPLSSVYSRLESIMSVKEQSAEGGDSQALNIAPPLRTEGGFLAQPQSFLSFTLLLSHPKQEFSLEMHGTKSLTELGLAPSATLTVMKCADRGLVYRGELESRFTQAQGNAMDVDGLTYEGLLELTERVGAAKPTAVTMEVLERNSTLLSPSTLKTDGDCHCPICLGEFDLADTNKTLRKLNLCGHVFHAACFATWLGTKSSCPICKCPVDKN